MGPFGEKCKVIWLKLDDNLDPVEDYEDSYTWAGDLPGWSDSCFNIPEQTTAQPTPEPTPTPVATPTPVLSLIHI